MTRTATLRWPSVSRAGAAPLAAVLLAAFASGLVAQAESIAAGRIYQAGAVLTSPLTGITVTVPAGFAGQWDADVGALSLQSQSQVFGGIWGWSQGSVEEVAEEVGSRLTGLGLQLRERGQAEVTPDRIRGTFDAYSSEGMGVLVAEVRRGQQGGVVAIAALAGQQSEAEAAGFVDAVAGSVRHTTPGAAGWRQQVQGSVLRWSSSGSDMSTGGGATATGASQSQATIAFCGGQYRYTESSESYVSIEGMSASNNSSDEHGGEWALVADLLGTPTLYLESTDGRSFAWTVEEAAEGVLIDGYLYRPSGSC